MEDAEDLVGIDGAQREGRQSHRACSVEMEARPACLFGEQPGDDLARCSGPLVVMARDIHQDAGLRGRRCATSQRHAPVADIGVGRSRLERLYSTSRPLVRLQ